MSISRFSRRFGVWNWRFAPAPAERVRSHLGWWLDPDPAERFFSQGLSHVPTNSPRMQQIDSFVKCQMVISFYLLKGG